MTRMLTMPSIVLLSLSCHLDLSSSSSHPACLRFVVVAALLCRVVSITASSRGLFAHAYIRAATIKKTDVSAPPSCLLSIKQLKAMHVSNPSDCIGLLYCSSNLWLFPQARVGNGAESPISQVAPGIFVSLGFRGLGFKVLGFRG